MGDYQTTQFNHFSRCKGIVGGLISSAIDFSYSHEKIVSTRTQNLFDCHSYSKLTQANKSYISGLFDASMDNLYRYELSWHHFTIIRVSDNTYNVKFYKNYDALPENLKRKTNTFHSGFFWKKSIKPFTIKRRSNLDSDLSENDIYQILKNTLNKTVESAS